ncbi:MAG: ABC transporter permease [Pseudomonadota bacterium]
MFRLAWASLLNRRLTAGLTLAAITLSVVLLLGVETVRNGAREGFASTVSGTDLIVGARSGSVNLLLYSVFRIGNATNNVSGESVDALTARPEVAWLVPISLGDSHRGFRVLGTTPDYFEHFAYGRRQSLAFASGGPFAQTEDAVIGSGVARALDYEIGDEIIVAHGLGAVSFQDHDEDPFRVVGILEPTGTPVDRTVHVGLDAIAAIHGETLRPGRSPDVTAALLGLTSPIATLSLQRWVNTYPEEPLSAILPGVALAELWSLVGAAETALLAVSALVVVTALIGLVTTILTGLEARQREIAVLRAVGARPRDILALLLTEAVGLAVAGAVLGTALLYALLFALRPTIEARSGLFLPIDWPGPTEWMLLGAVVLGGAPAGLIPAIRAYRLSLANGLTARL